MKKENHIVYIPKIGTFVDNNAFGGHYITKWEQKRLIEWKENQLKIVKR